MRTGASLALIGVGAILAFAVTANTSVFNLHTAGYVLMIIGVIGFYLRSRGWVGRQILVRRTRSRVVEEVPVPPSVDDTIEDGVADRQTVPTLEPETEVIEEREYRPD